MPYVARMFREHLDPYIKMLGGNVTSVGDINYVVTRVIGQYLKRKDLNYGNIAGVIGTLQCVILELYRRVAVDYEETKIIQNGDVPEYEEDYFATL